MLIYQLELVSWSDTEPGEHGNVVALAQITFLGIVTRRVRDTVSWEQRTTCGCSCQKKAMAITLIFDIMCCPSSPSENEEGKNPLAIDGTLTQLCGSTGGIPGFMLEMEI